MDRVHWSNSDAPTRRINGDVWIFLDIIEDSHIMATSCTDVDYPVVIGEVNGVWLYDDDETKSNNDKALPTNFALFPKLFPMDRLQKGISKES